MADVNKILGTVKDTFDTVAIGAKVIAGKAADKAKEVAAVTKLKMAISAEKKTIDKAYLEIGKLYYETHKDTPDSLFIQLCDEIKLAGENIAAIRTELEAMKASGEYGDIDVEIEVEDAPVEDAPAPEKAEGSCGCGCGCE